MLPWLHVIRHGETEWSLAGRHTGRTDPPLTARGEDEAGELGRRFREIPFTHVFCSPRQRAVRTCELAGLQVPAGIEPQLAEWDYGDYEGRRTDEIRVMRPDWQLFRDGCPGGESPADVSDRADRLIARLRALEGDVALFTHGHFGRVLGVRWIGLPVAKARHFLLSTASHGVLGYEHDRSDQPVIVQWNAAAPGAPARSAAQRTGDSRRQKQRAIQRWENEGGEIPEVPRAH